MHPDWRREPQQKIVRVAIGGGKVRGKGGVSSGRVSARGGAATRESANPEAENASGQRSEGDHASQEDRARVAHHSGRHAAPCARGQLPGGRVRRPKQDSAEDRQQRWKQGQRRGQHDGHTHRQRRSEAPVQRERRKDETDKSGDDGQGGIGD